MTRQELRTYINSIREADHSAEEQAALRQAALVKPPGSLGRLEELSVRLAGMTGEVCCDIHRPAVLIFAADNGVVAEGVTSAPREVTMMQTANFTRGITGAGALGHRFGTDLLVTDVGIDGDLPRELLCDREHPGEMAAGRIWDRKVAYGTGNIAEQPAMNEEQLMSAISTGIEAAEAAFDVGYDILGIGEMGIGNTTTSTAVLAAMTGAPVRDITGRGGGLTDEGLERKRRVIESALERHGLGEEGSSEEDDLQSVLDIIAKVGGLDIAAMTGAFLASAANRRPVVADGYISAVAAAAACSMVPHCREYVLASHASGEPGCSVVMEHLGAKPLLDLQMCLGEGSGCILAFQIIQGACGVMNGMATFDEAGIDDGYLDAIRGRTEKGSAGQ